MTVRKEFTCDMPGCPSKVVADEVPEGWGCFDALGKKSYCCSIPCLQKFVNGWAENHETVSAALGVTSVGVVFTCDDCGKEILMRPGDEWPAWCEIKLESTWRMGFCSADCLRSHLRHDILPAIMNGRR